MNPITFWVQNKAIDQLVQLYGAQLEKLEPGSRRELIAYLSIPGEWYWGESSDGVDEAFELLEKLSRHDKDLLIEAIAASLTQGSNPWLDTAHEPVAIATDSLLRSPISVKNEQKKGRSADNASAL